MPQGSLSIRRAIFCSAAFLITFSNQLFAQVNEEPKPFKPFYVYQDKLSPNRFTPSGYMPDGDCIKMDEGWNQQCQEGKTCIKASYDAACSLQRQRWGGVYWLNPPDNWGDRKGGYNLNGASKLVFWARGEKGGEQISEFKVGGVGTNKTYPDSDTISIGPVILPQEWREYEIDLRGRDLSYLSGGFAWVTNADSNPEGAVFFLDDIHFE
jgi:hypothetical protein